MSMGRIAMMTLLAVALAVSACGRMGDPVRPGSDKDPKKQATTSTTTN